MEVWVRKDKNCFTSNVKKMFEKCLLAFPLQTPTTPHMHIILCKNDMHFSVTNEKLQCVINCFLQKVDYFYRFF